MVIDYPKPICLLKTKQRITLVNTSAICGIGSPVTPPPPLPVDIGLIITLVAAHTLLAGQPIYITPVGTLDKVNSSSTPCIGVAVGDAYAGTSVAYISEGSVSRLDWTQLTGSPELNPGFAYYLSGVGGLINTPPTSGILQRVGIAVSRSMLDINISQPIQLAQP